MKQVLVIRKDLNMRKGKIAAQAAHASLAAIIDEGKLRNSKYVEEWLKNSFTKICVYVDNEQELKDIYVSAIANMMHCSIIQDNGTTEFKGVPTYTAAAVGPGPVEKIDKIAGHLNLL